MPGWRSRTRTTPSITRRRTTTAVVIAIVAVTTKVAWRPTSIAGAIASVILTIILAIIAALVTVVGPASATIITALLSNKLHRQHRLVQFPTVDLILGAGSFFHRAELDKGVVALHFNANQLAVRFKEHSQVFSLGSFFVKVDHKQGLRRMNVPAAIIFFSLDASVSTSKFRT